MLHEKIQLGEHLGFQISKKLWIVRRDSSKTWLIRSIHEKVFLPTSMEVCHPLMWSSRCYISQDLWKCINKIINVSWFCLLNVQISGGLWLHYWLGSVFRRVMRAFDMYQENFAQIWAQLNAYLVSVSIIVFSIIQLSGKIIWKRYFRLRLMNHDLLRKRKFYRQIKNFVWS